MRALKFIGLIIAILGLLTALVALITEGLKLYREISAPTPQPQTTLSSPTSETTTANSTESTATVSYFSDDFNSGTDFNKNYWGKDGDLACSTQLVNGQVEFSSTTNNTSSLVCLLFGEGILYEEVGSMEATIKAQIGATGDYSIGIIEFSKGTFDEGTQNWIIQCGLRQIPNQNVVEVFFNVHSTYPQGDPEIYKASSALVGRSYSMKLEIVPETDIVNCYADGQIIGTYEGSNLASLHNEKIDRHLLGFWSPNSQAIYYADDVKFSPPK